MRVKDDIEKHNGSLNLKNKPTFLRINVCAGYLKGGVIC